MPFFRNISAPATSRVYRYEPTVCGEDTAKGTFSTLLTNFTLYVQIEGRSGEGEPWNNRSVQSESQIDTRWPGRVSCSASAAAAVVVCSFFDRAHLFTLLLLVFFRLLKSLLYDQHSAKH